jgi:thiol:disulfide interchange protein
MRFLTSLIIMGGLLASGCGKAPESPSAKNGGAKLPPSDTASKAVDQTPEPAVFESLSFDKALARALDDKKVVMIDFYADWCGPCKKLDSDTWPDAEVSKWLAAHTVPIKIDIEKEEKLADKFKIQSIPALVFVKPDGSEVGRIVGFRGPKDFLEDAGKLLK